MAGYSKQEDLSHPVCPINMRSSITGASHILFSGIRATRLIATSNVLFLLLIMTGLSSCDLFSTREPEEPTGSQSGGDIALTSDEVFSIFETSFVLRDPDLYLNIISNDFSYEATPDAYPGSEPIFDNWTVNEENNFIRTLLSQALLPVDSLVSIEFNQRGEPIFWADSVKYSEFYTLEIHAFETELPNTYGGAMELVLRQEGDGGWRIYHWKDETAGVTPTFSQLRAALR